MVAESKVMDKKVLEKALDLLKKEFTPVEYAKFLAMIGPKVGDSAKELRKFRDRATHGEILERLKKRGAVVKP